MLRNQNVELLRIAAAFGIVVFHSGAPGSEIGYSGLIAFTALSTLFAGSSITKLSKRILIPWAFWSLFYLIWRYLANGIPFHPGLSATESIFYGTHLWFLPFIFVANSIITRINCHHLSVASSAAAFILLLSTPWWRDVQLAFDPPVAQFLHAIPAALLGVALRTKAGIAISALGLLTCLLWQVPGVSAPYALGGGGVIAAILLPKTRYNFSNFSALMFGVYLVHIAVLRISERLIGSESLATASFAFLASLIGVWLTRKNIPLSRSILG